MNVLKGLKSQESIYLDGERKRMTPEYIDKILLIYHLTKLHLKVTPGYKSKNLELHMTESFAQENDSIYALDKIIERILKERNIKCILEQENLIVEDLRTGKQTILR